MTSNGAPHAGSPARQQEEEEEMLAEERDLAEDAQWKRIQQNTFTRWANEHLKNANKHIYSLETDLEDGLILIALIEVLSGKRMPKHSKRPNFRSQKLENVSVALKFLERDENIKIVNIDSTHIVDCQLKLILGLIWTLILHYSISMPMWEGDDTVPGEKTPTPKQRLMNWIGSKMPDLPVRNFTSDWQDGKAIGALVDGVAPGLCPDWSDWKPEDALKNATEAMGLADDWLNVPQLIQPEDMVDPNVDELSMMTYLSQYPNAKLKPGAPLRNKTNPNRVRCYGPGVEPSGPVVGAPTFFTVETFSAGQGKVDCQLIRPNGASEPIDAKFNNDRNLTYSCQYTPVSEGPHKVIVKFIGNEIPKSPFNVMVEGYAGDPSKVTASGPGLEPVGVVVNRPTYFDIFTQDAGKGTPEVVILDPKGKQNPAMLKLKEVKQGQWRCEYLAEQIGLYSINIYFATKQIPHSPYGVKVAPACDPRRVRATGRGLQNKGVRVGETADFKIWTEGAGEGEPKVRIIGPGGADEPAELKRVSDFVYEGAYYPKKDGRYIVMITYGGHEIPKSPFEVNVGPHAESSIRCYGPGLKGGVVNSPAVFTVETNGETGALGFSVEGPSQAQIQCNDNGDGSADVSYLPTAPGEYAVHVLCENEDIPKSPWMAEIIPKTDYDASKVKAYGPGIQKDGVTANVPTYFTVDTTRAGKAPLDVSLMDENYTDVPVRVTEKSPGVYNVDYVVSSSGKHTVQVNYGGVAVPDSPFRVQVTSPVDATKVQVFGPGLEPGVRAQTPTHFNVDARGAGPGELRVGLKDNQTGREVPVTLTDNGDGTMTADYSYPKPGPYTLNVTYGGKAIPQSPLQVTAQPKVDVSKVKVDNLEPTVFLNSPADVIVDARAIPAAHEGTVTCPIKGPSGEPCPSYVEPLGDGTFKATYTPTEPGPHQLDIAYEGVAIPGAPFRQTAKPGCDPRRVSANGPGLLRGIVNKPNTFTVNTRGAGAGGLGLAVEGPSEAKMACVDNKDGSCTVEYIPTEPGEYDVNVKYSDQHIPGSPFKVPVECEVDADSVVARGPGLEPQQCRANVPLSFTVDATKSAPAPLNVDVRSDKGPLPRKPTVRDNGDGTYDVTYHPPPEGSQCQPRVTWGGKDIKGSPWSMPVRPTCEPNKVRLTGPGVSGKGVPASLPTDFTVDTSDAGFGDLETQIVGPDGYPRKVEVADNGDGTYTARYTPDDCGQYKVNVKYGGREVPGCPLPVQAVPTGQANKCKIEDGDFRDQIVSVGEKYCITVNAKNAGNGNVTCRIRSTSGSGDVDIDIQDNGDGTFNIYYKVKDAGEYSLNIKFGGQPVPEGLYSFSAQSEDNVTQVRSQHLQSATSTTTSTTVQEDYFEYRPVELNNIPLPTTGGNVTAEVNMPSGNIDQPIIEDNRDGTVSVKYEPKEEGLHELVVKYNGENVQDHPRASAVSTVPDRSQVAPQNSSESVRSCGFVPTVKPPTRNISARETNLGRWRAKHKDPYQPEDPLAGVLESDICTKMVKTCINRQLLRREPKRPVPVLRADPEKVKQLHLSREKTKIKCRSERFLGTSETQVVKPFRRDQSEKAEQSMEINVAAKLPKQGGVDEEPSEPEGCPPTVAMRPPSAPPKKGVSFEDKVMSLPETVVLQSPDPFTFGKDSCVVKVSKRQVPAKKGENSKHVHASPLECILRKAPFDSAKVDSLITSEPVLRQAPDSHSKARPKPSIQKKVSDIQGSLAHMQLAFNKNECSSNGPTPKDENSAKAKSGNPSSLPLRKPGHGKPPAATADVADCHTNATGSPEVGSGDKPPSVVSVHTQSSPELSTLVNSSTAASESFVLLRHAISSHLSSAGDEETDENATKAWEAERNAERSRAPKTAAGGSSSSLIVRLSDRRKSSAVSFPVKQRIHFDVPPSQCSGLFVPSSHCSGDTWPLLPAGSASSAAELPQSHTNHLNLATCDSTGGSGLLAAAESPIGSTLSTGFSVGHTWRSERRCSSGRELSRRLSAIRPPSQSSAHTKRHRDTRRCFSGNDLGGSRVIFLDGVARRCSSESVDSGHGGDSPPGRFGLDALLSTRLVKSASRHSSGAEGPEFLSVSSSYASVGSVEVLVSDATRAPEGNTLLGIPLVGQTAALSKIERERGKPSLPDKTACASSVKTGSVPGRTGSAGRFKSATSVPTVATANGGRANHGDSADGQSWGRWRRSVTDARLSRTQQRHQKRGADHSGSKNTRPGSPFKFHVDSISSGYVTAYGPGLVHGITGEPANFTIATKDAGAGGLSLAVEGPSKAEISCHDNKDGTVSVSYLPTAPGEYKVAVKFADKHIKGSPYSVKVTGEGRKRNQVSLGSQSEVALPGKVTEKDIKALNASITAPSGLEEPCFLKKLPNDHLGISFTPREIGQHLVMVKKKGVEIQGSPFKIMVSPKEVGDASKVKVSGNALKEGKTHQDNKVLIDTKEAGYGGLSMSIEGPSKAEIKCDDKDDGKLEVSYNPKEPGFYIINLKFADHHVEGSPFTAKVSGEGTNNQTERIKRDRDAVPITSVGSSCALTFKMPGVSAMDLSATVTSPGGVVEDASLSELDDNLHAVNFVPKELGVHTVSVRYRDVHIPGSPFQFTVGPLKDGGAHRVHAGGPGLERGEQDMPNEFNVWTREAGAGSLAISVEGPSKAEIDFKDRKDGSCYVSYVVSEPGEYRVGVKFNDSHIPDSPYKVFVTPSNTDAHKISVNQLPDAGVQVNKPIVFLVDRTGCKGQLDVKAVSPSGEEDDCVFDYLDEDTYSCRFLPKENGIHQLHVKWNNVHVPGSPFRLKVGKQDADPAAVHAHGKGLDRGQTGQKSDFIIDTCNAGAGTLAVTIDGPSKVSMDCTEVDEGYKVRYTPLSPGDYYCGVKYDGYHIAGSPFRVPVEGEELAEKGPKEQSAVVVETVEKQTVRSKQEKYVPSLPKFDSDATKVTSKGMGLKKAFVGRQNQFTVDAGKAGQDMLWVGCFGPKNPCEEVHIKHMGRNQYQVFYTVKERGKYILVVRWGDQDIPGSPFEVEV